jgi:hypothetical protein
MRLHRLLTLATIAAVSSSGCATSPPDSAAAIKAAQHGANAVFACKITAIFTDGHVSVADQGAFAGELQFDRATSTFFWNGDPLMPVKTTRMLFTFFEPHKHRLVQVPRSLEDSGEAVLHIAFSGSKGFPWTCVQATTARNLILLLDEIPPLNNSYALLAQEKLIDGTRLPLESIEYVGRIDASAGSIRLNGRPATMRVIQLSDGGFGLQISGEGDEVRMWPNGAWLSWKSGDPGIALSGSDVSFQELYITLRAIARTDHPTVFPE